ncbi:MAG: CHAD domain-containing protein [Geminicoccaceae bacterium]|nr:CHAD domain-containing protein [Geminicoccaceae bacterium]
MAPSPDVAETELKLLAAPKVLDAIARMRWLKPLQRGTARTLKLDATYYDTKDRRLRRDGLSLRVRGDGTGGAGTVQTIKARGGHKLGRRDEWEWPLEGADPDLSLVDDPALRGRLGGLTEADLEPVFRTLVERRVLLLDWPGEDGAGGARIEVALDRGRIEAGSGREAPTESLGEIELELKEGDPKALLALAKALRARHPLRLGTVDKSERGHMLADGLPPAHRKAGTPPLDPDMKLEAAIEAIMEGCLVHWLANEAAAKAGREADGLHQLRVAIRRIRSALALFKGALGPSAEAWNGRLRGLVHGLGHARDLDVFLAERLPPLEAALPGDGGLKALRAEAEAARDRARSAVAATLESQAYADLVLDLATWIARRGWREGGDPPALDAPLRGAAKLALDRLHRKVKKRGRGFVRLKPEGRHRLRIALKKLRYAAEFLETLFPGKATRRYLKAATGLQDGLGHGNDLAVGAGLAGRLAAEARGAAPRSGTTGSGADLLRGWNTAEAAALEDGVRRAWKRFRRRERFWRDG